MSDINTTKTEYLSAVYDLKFPHLDHRNDPKVTNQFLIAFIILLNQVSEEESAHLSTARYDYLENLYKRMGLRENMLYVLENTEYLPMDDHLQQIGFLLKLLTVSINHT